jgi:hypothetical protein
MTTMPRRDECSGSCRDEFQQMMCTSQLVTRGPFFNVVTDCNIRANQGSRRANFLLSERLKTFASSA